MVEAGDVPLGEPDLTRRLDLPDDLGRLTERGEVRLSYSGLHVRPANREDEPELLRLQAGLRGADSLARDPAAGAALTTDLECLPEGDDGLVIGGSVARELLAVEAQPRVREHPRRELARLRRGELLARQTQFGIRGGVAPQGLFEGDPARLRRSKVLC